MDDKGESGSQRGAILAGKGEKENNKESVCVCVPM